MTSEHPDDPYRSPAVQTEIDPVAATPGRGEMTVIVMVGIVLGLVTFLGTCFGVGLLGASLFGIYGAAANISFFLAWPIGIAAGLAAGLRAGRSIYRNVQDRHRQKSRDYKIASDSPASASTDETS